MNNLYSTMEERTEKKRKKKTICSNFRVNSRLKYIEGKLIEKQHHDIGSYWFNITTTTLVPAESPFNLTGDTSKWKFLLQNPWLRIQAVELLTSNSTASWLGSTYGINDWQIKLKITPY